MNESFYWNRTEKATHVQTNNGVVVATNNVSRTFFVGRGRSGVSNPNWKKQIKKGQNATTVFNGTRTTVKMEDSTAKAVYFSSPTVWTEMTYRGVPWFLNRDPDNPLGNSNEARDKASVYFLQRLRETRTQTMGMVILGEAAESLRMILKPAKTLRAEIPKYFSSLAKRRRGAMGKSTAKSKAVRLREDKKRESQLKKIAADTWLEFAFGWKPLMMDIQDGCKALGRLNENNFPKRISATGKVEDVPWNGGTSEDYLTTGPNMYPRIRYHVGVNREVACHIRGATRVQNWSSPGAQNADLLGFNLESFVPSLWELIPWSFFVDYFTNIGDILSAGFTSTSSLAWTSRTYRGRSYLKSGASLALNQNGVAASFDPGKLEIEKTSVARDAGGPVVPELRFSLPGSNTQWVNIAALFSDHRSLIPFHK